MKNTINNVDKDSIANISTIAAAGTTFMNVETMLTIVVLVSALVLNLVRIWSYISSKRGE